MTGDRPTLETADVEWHPSSEPGSMLIAYVGLYRVHLGHDGECWAWRLDLLGECDSPDTQVDGANGLVAGSLGKAQTRAVEVARLLSGLVEGVDVRAYRERLPASDGGELAEVRDELARILGLDPGPGSDDIGDLLTTVRVRLRGPTEGASCALTAIVDHGYMGSGSSRAAVVHVMDWMVDTASAGLGGRPVPELTDGPPTGGASPTGNAAGDLALQIAPVLTRQRDRSQARLDALIGAVEAFIAGQKLAREGASFIGASGRVECYTGTIDALAVMVDAAKAD